MKINDKKRTILIVDDERVNRVLLNRIFSSDYSVLEAENGLFALKLLNTTNNISAVILDIQMPELDGFGVLAEMARSEQLKDIPVIVVTAASDEETQFKVLSAGAIDVITKPLRSLLILQRINNIVTRIEAMRALGRAEQIENDLMLADTDKVSGLLNKNAFIRQTSRILRDNTNKQYILMRWDIDNFKVYNDSFGSAVGDDYLHKVGAFYLENQDMLEGIILTARLDADHFILLREAESFDAERSAKNLENNINRLKTRAFEYVPRMGLYRVEEHDADVSLMCDRALLALKSVKHSYEKRYAWYDESMRNELIKEQRIVGSMAYALKNNEFKVYLQPQYNHATGKLMGAEALVRWYQPDNEIIAPNIFIPIFEKNGFIYELDKYIWEQTCILINKWKSEGKPPVPVSVNVSRFDVLHDTLFNTVTGLVEKYGIPLDLFRLEITESAFAKDTGRIIETIKALREYGFIIEIDDFGSGYSSFNTLKDVPANILK